MNSFARLARNALVIAASVFCPSIAFAQTLTLDPLSMSLPVVPATAGDLLTPAAAIPPSAPFPPALSVTATQLGLLPGDVIDALTFVDDAFPGPGSSVYFSVDRVSAGPGVVAPPDVSGENVVFVPAGTQSEAASDIFVTNDGACLGFGMHTQALDGDGAPIGPPSVCGYGGGPPFGLGLAEAVPFGPPPPPPYTDAIDGFDWGAPGRGRIFCTAVSLAPGSPTLIPGANPLFPAGAEPGDILLLCSGGAPASTPAIFPGPTALGMGLVSGGPGCAPPLCDDIDALSGFYFSLSPASPSVTGAPFFSAADILTGGPGIVLAAGALGLTPFDNVTALEATMITVCPVFPGVDLPDSDGVGACDNCPGTFNPGQEDTDGDGIGDACDPCTDLDLDGFGNMVFPANLCPTDLCPFTPGANADSDADGWADECDNCPLLANADQADGDSDGVGDACDNCPVVFNPAQTNSDTDGFGDDCDNCDLIDNPSQADVDVDTVGDACDDCPHIAGGIPSPLTSMIKAQLNYTATGPGSSDDKVKAIKAVFTTGTAFDPDSTDDVHVTMTDTSSGDMLYARSLTTASGFWAQASSGNLSWKFTDAGPPGAKAQLKEAPIGSMTYAFKLNVKDDNVNGPLTPTLGDIETTLEIAPAGLCLNIMLPTCINRPTSDLCKP